VKPQQPSITAKLIAASMVLLGSDARTRRLLAPGSAALSEHFLAGAADAPRADRWLSASARRPWSRAAWRALERCVLPGIVQHYALRKRWIEQRCDAALRAGVERVVVLGAGFDTLGCRLGQRGAGIEVIEIDHPATQAAKRRAVATLLPPLQAPPHFIACDLAREAFPAALLKDARPTLVIAEGLLMYLDAERVHRLFDELHALSPAGVHFVFSHLVQWPDGRAGFRPYSRLVDAWLAWRGEPFTWALAPAALPALLAQHRFTLIDGAAGDALAAGLTLQGENLAHCCAP
jgi:methyltransferase (TIGR00027 family)